MAFVVPATAAADVLVKAVPARIACGKSIKLGVWYQSYSGGPRWAVLKVKSHGRVKARKKVHATTTWRCWYFDPNCGQTYTVVYKTPGGTGRFPAEVRS